MRYRVLVTAGAERDLEEIHDYVAEHDAPAKAVALIGRLSRVIDSLATQPQRGPVPRELRDLGLRQFRQLYFKPYRLIYRIDGEQVFVMLVADGRRDMQALLARRLLRA